MKLKSNKRLGASLTKASPININEIQTVSRYNRSLKQKSGSIKKLTSLTVSKSLSSSPDKLKRTTIQWMERYAWHGVFIISGLFWLVVCGLIWFVSSL
ncbi:hypothetical protein E5C26_12010 [Serratia proteamaculans]|uniref:hypothetical protein n=1 Tax=Serratia proteamaculans TaxID=28151 RepID=UPI0010766BD8|nr:hypothetical protein [Serratia proteamaculans]TFZ51080.1 hypothetical protein E5C26_12010 [Serratia proteamaculans]